MQLQWGKDVPPLKTLLAALHEARGQHQDINAQIQFMIKLLGRKYTQQLSADDKTVKDSTMMMIDKDATLSVDLTIPDGEPDSRASLMKRKAVEDAVDEDRATMAKKKIMLKFQAKPSPGAQQGSGDVTGQQPTRPPQPEVSSKEPEDPRHEVRTTLSSRAPDRPSELEPQVSTRAAAPPQLFPDIDQHEQERLLRHQLQPSDDEYDQGITWSAQAGLRIPPEILPTRKPAPINDLEISIDGNWVDNRMRGVEESIAEAVRICFAAHNISDSAQMGYVMKPEQELEGLYGKLFGRDRRTVLFEVLSDEVSLKQTYVMEGLIGAAIFNLVLDAEMPWNIEEEITDGLGANLPAVEDVLTSMGHNYDNFVKYVAARQMRDPKLKAERGEILAKKLAGQVALTLLPQLKTMHKKDNQALADRSNRKQWIKHLEEAFRRALVIKQTLECSRLGPFQTDWPDHGTAAISRDHQQKFGLGAKAQRCVLFGILPAVFRLVAQGRGQTGSRICFSRACMTM